MAAKALAGAFVIALTSASLAQADCLRLGAASTGALSTESATLYNDCPVRVAFQFCNTSANGGGSFSCTSGLFGYGSVEANGSTYVSVMGAGVPVKVNWGSCEAESATAQPPSPSNPHWNGSDVDVTCQ